jgi:L-iditol 2-dehydrogenase
VADSMRALIFEGPNRLELRDWPKPQAGPGEVVVRVHTSTVCGTDLRIVSGRKTRDVRPGHPIGHECAGVVAAVGAGVTQFPPGDAVAVHPVVTCGQCAFCAADQENLCAERITLGYHTDGSFAEYMSIPARAVERGNLFKLPESVPLRWASVLEPAGCCVNGQEQLGLVELTQRTDRPVSIVIFGGGPIGLLHVMLARARAVREPHIVVVEPREHRRATALDLGADAVVAPDEFSAVEAFDAAILAAGVPALINVALRAVRKGGRVNLFAGFDVGTQAAVDVNAIHYRQILVSGASESRRRDFAEALRLAASGRVDLGQVITHRLPLESYEEGFAAAADGTALKVAFEM